MRTRGKDDVLVVTKTGVALDGDRRRADLSPARIVSRLGRSIDRIGRADLYLSHVFDPGTPVRQWLEVFAQAQQDGRIRAYGVCNVTGAQLAEILGAADDAGLPRPVCVQSSFNLLHRTDESEVLPLVIGEGLAYLPASPLAGGVLSDRYLDGAPVPPGSRIAVAGDLLYAGMHTPENIARVARMRDVARELDVSVAGLALAWLLATPGVTAPIIAPSRSSQWAAVEEALRIGLDEQTRGRLSALFD
ncbi:aryl-alcohol dehydrogenase-like predicted oxidoreductase [Catenuloplanes niger]|uniref:Aryl-alcohol dehydrogenase-like predicted oxidoreductase n=1 Tax=Catenuloplanes niger TaxID=587534 RepID=A0AAE3ZX99_9ACTN|nr:aryl-alcohol dehydrogenase-like predicted oxidoreductase [Catenuloplanes niger]